jgi:hypothetical protein
LEILYFFLQRLEKLLRYFETNFLPYLHKQQRVPQSRLMRTKKDLLDKWEQLMEEIPSINHHGLLNLVREVLSEFIQRINERQFITIREVKYHRQLIEDIYRTQAEEQALKELIIYRNLNHKQSTAYLARQLDQLLLLLATPEEKLNVLRLEYKALQQLRVSSKQVYDPRYPSLKQYMSQYIENEMLYLEQKMEGIKPLNEQTVDLPSFKVVCNLSTDQIAAILRAADDTRLLSARSMNAIFKAIIPYLSTPKKAELSWQSVRAKAYDTEQRDKEIVIKALQEMINRIKEY